MCETVTAGPVWADYRDAERVTVGDVYYAPVPLREGCGAIVMGSHYGVRVDARAGALGGVVYSSAERATAALLDPEMWHPSHVGVTVVCALRAVSSTRFEFASDLERARWVSAVAAVRDAAGAVAV